ncbi:2-amino-4-hydroxy-6-hydroxymethyldihydropteridine diphosphokinase [Psychrobacter sp. TAE2020]|uniref:2-amino-4-hydroxy-6- hydroxymethyldihydropteridine diphosphokinase n=1 Tax=Psychrobacter sp. TAE2020 TaxID=2846762 RepID=UPI001C1053F2|nr:2-amino-4-hydroxy-6-hydroxymethyldihydropteridine diphosphokinase [Psychrobacter sp. TAE2020]MBU5615852.1 2-amino-4-hydroxy-6-hydroxymethyldihydropteridine diphosphokinase [Psychrobacter sp. TAE2020]
MHKDIDQVSLELALAKLKRQSSEQLQMQTVTAVLLALGSNHDSEQHLMTVRKNLTELGEIKLSSALQNPDFTASLEQAKPDYINQCVYLILSSPMSLHKLQQLFKQLEGNCNRCRQHPASAIRQVTMDIDILLVKLELENDTDDWIVISDRYPFKAHERAGFEELAVVSL